jgi:hypothetical protein
MEKRMPTSIARAVHAAVFVVASGRRIYPSDWHKTGAAAAGTANVRREAVLGTGTFTAFVENMDPSLAFYHTGQIRSCSLCSILRELKNVISRRESLGLPSPWK